MRQKVLILTALQSRDHLLLMSALILLERGEVRELAHLEQLTA